ncbi:alpha/beta fold hydrolase [Rhodohalobacter sp. SW132]|uniref:alpha/beta hydrolase n=1 Tax=Rhodohalobacter sp. SW132 TaxID=2293433 RepID=UPI000E2335A8|nr:alpha/beta fold hydrolase [Rhodohalobacter sp. SW132]REL37716.1 alpha/beta fold hydrolase [Rhodohalobacter sp. SW132]
MRPITSILFILLFTACTTIEITEQDAFENHRTVTPETFDFQSYTLHEKDIETDDGETISSWFIEHENAQATVIYFGGNAYLMVKSPPLLDVYSEIPVNLVLFDYRGYGKSSGSPSVQGVQTDAIAVFNETAAHFRSNDANHPIFVHGQSMGTFIAAFMADHETVDGYILENPITEVNNWTRRMLPWILRPFVRFDIERSIDSQSNLERAASTDSPLLIFTGSNDMITQSWMADEIYEASASDQKDLVKIAGGTHNDLPSFSIYQTRLREFLTGENNDYQ